MGETVGQSDIRKMNRQYSSNRSLVRPGTDRSYLIKKKRVLLGGYHQTPLPVHLKQSGDSSWSNVMAMSEHLDLDPDGLLRSGLAESAINILPKCVTEQINQVFYQGQCDTRTHLNKSSSSLMSFTEASR